jgi:hypothetical protein
MLDTLTALSDTDLLDRLARLVTDERDLTVQVVAHIAEVDARRLYTEAACSSMFVYCTQRLGLSENAAQRRIVVARASRRWPLLLDVLAEGRLHLTALAMMAKHLTDDNVHELVDKATGLSKRQLLVVLADLAPKPDVRPSIRRKPRCKPAPATSRPPDSRSASGSSPVDQPASGSSSPEPSGDPSLCLGTVDPSEHAAPPEPLGQDRHLVRFTASGEWVAKLDEARDLMSHRVPDGDVVAILDQALDLPCPSSHSVATLPRALTVPTGAQSSAPADRQGQQGALRAAGQEQEGTGPAPRSRALPIAPHPQRHQARRVRARRWELHLRRRRGDALRLAAVHRVPPRRSLGETPRALGGWAHAALPRPQPARRAGGLRR